MGKMEFPESEVRIAIGKVDPKSQTYGDFRRKWESPPGVLSVFHGLTVLLSIFWLNKSGVISFFVLKGLFVGAGTCTVDNAYVRRKQRLANIMKLTFYLNVAFAIL